MDKTRCEKVVYTPNQIASMLGLKVSTIYALISQGKLKTNKTGSRRFVTRNQLDAYLINRRTLKMSDGRIWF